MDRRRIIATSAAGAPPRLVALSNLADTNSLSATPVLTGVFPSDVLIAHALVAGGGLEFATAPAGEGWSTVTGVAQGPNTRVFAKIWGAAGQVDDLTPTFTTLAGSVGVIIQVWRGASAIIAFGADGATGSGSVMTPDPVESPRAGASTVVLFSSVGSSEVISITSGTNIYSGPSYSSTTGTDRAYASACRLGTGVGWVGGDITAQGVSSVGWNAITVVLK